MSSFSYSTAQFPLVIFTCPPCLEAEETRETLVRYQREVLAAERTFALIVDASDVEVLPSALVRRAITDWMHPVQALGERQMVGMAMTTSSALIRGAMTAINWVVPAKIPLTFEASRYESARWSLDRLRERNVPVPASVAEYVAGLASTPVGRVANGR